MKRVCVLLAMLVGSGACGERQEAPPPPGVPVKAARVERRSVPVEIRAVGTVEPSISVAVTSQVGGTLQLVHFAEGDYVQEGQLLFTIDRAPFLAQLQAQEANLIKARAEAQNARAQLQRYAGLVKKDFVTEEQFDEAQANAEALKATVKAAEAAVESAKLELNYTEIRATVGGRTGNVNVKPGNVVRANDQALPLVTVNRVKPVLVRFAVPEQYLSNIRARAREGALPVKARIKGAQTAATGELSFIDNEVDRASGTILLKGTFRNEDEALWPGQFVEVDVLLRTEPDALVVPSEALQAGQQGPYLWVIRPDETVETRQVVPAFSLERETVLSSGVAERERVVTDGQFRLAAGVKVEVQ